MSEGSSDVGEDVALEVRKIGDEVGVLLPRELLDRWHVREGDLIRVGVQVPGQLHNEAVTIARNAFVEYEHTYRELAK